MASTLPELIFLGSGEFGVPTLRALTDAGKVALVVSQPDRQAGRGQRLTPTPVSTFAIEQGLPLLRPADCNLASVCAEIRSAAAQACARAQARGIAQPAPCLVVIAFGQKLSSALLEGLFAVNLHGSLLPRWRGAAPIQRALIEADVHAGVTVISLAERMDAGVVYATRSIAVGARQTAGELHDSLSALGPEAVQSVLAAWMAGTLAGQPQDEALATRARKLSKADAWVDLTQEATRVRARINGLNPWPGCALLVQGRPLLARRCEELPPGIAAGGAPAAAGVPAAAGAPAAAAGAPTGAAGAPTDAPAAHAPAPGTLFPDGTLWCGRGAVRLLEVQAPGATAMSFAAWVRGARLDSADALSACSTPPPERGS